MKTTQYCAAMKQRLQITSDYALAKALGVPKQTISNYANGVRTFDNTMAAKVAEILDVPVMKVIADMELERGTNDELWKRIARRAAGVLVPAAIASVALPPSSAEASVLQRGGSPLCYVNLRSLWALPESLRRLLVLALTLGLADPEDPVILT